MLNLGSDLVDVGGGGGGGGFSSRSSSTIIQNGRRITTTDINENGQVRREVQESDVRTGELLSLSVDGQPQPISESLGYR